MSGAIDRDWDTPAVDADGSVWVTVEHLAEGLLSYAVRLVPVPPGLPTTAYPLAVAPRGSGDDEGGIHAERALGPAAPIRLVNAYGRLVAAAVRSAPAGHLAPHVWGRADVEAFAAMAVVETLAHLHDVAEPLGIEWAPDGDLCRRAVDRLFPDAPDHGDGALVLLHVTGRADLPGRPRPGPDWRWYADVRD